jgi:hypothetical protein
MFTRIALALAFTALVVLPAAAQAPKREITKIAGDVYRFQNKFHFALVTVTADGDLPPLTGGPGRRRG